MKQVEPREINDLFILQLRRIRAVSNNSRELPPVNMGHSVEDFFDVVLTDTKAGKKLPNWYAPVCDG